MFVGYRLLLVLTLVCVCRVWVVVAVIAGTDLVHVCRVWVVGGIADTDLVHVCRV